MKLVEVKECEKLMNPPVSECIDIGDDDTWNVNLNNMIEKQWYSFKLDTDITIYLMLEDGLLIQTSELPKAYKQISSNRGKTNV